MRKTAQTPNRCLMTEAAGVAIWHPTLAWGGSAVAWCALALAGCASVPTDTTLPLPVQRALQQADMTDQVLGVLAFPLEKHKGGSPGLRLNADLPKQPGSTMKLVTTIVALDRLGANARGRTDLLVADSLVGDVLPGPLYLRGGADTDLDWGALWGLLRQLREQGVRHIQGGLVVDRSMFRPARLDVGVPAFDEAPEFQYNAIPDALNLNTGLLGFVLQSDAQQLTARTSPALLGVRIDTTGIALVDKPCAKWGDDWKLPMVQANAEGINIVLQGQYPMNCLQQRDFNLIDRQWVAGAVVRQIWQQLGGQIDGVESDGVTPAGARVLVTHLGRPFAEVARGLMKRSDNPLARLTYLRLGAQAANGEEQTLDAAARTVREWFDAKGIATAGMVLDNGSGLSRSERITPSQLAALLVAAYQGPHFPELLSSLPVAGLDGTLSRRFKGTPAQGRARLKTGTLRNAVGLAGFVPDANNRLWVVVALLNHEQAMSKGRPVLDSIIDWVAAQP